MEITTFANEMKQYSIEKWQKILNHKFVIELSKDVLPMNKFLFYIKQDHYFLQEFAKIVLFTTKQKTMDIKMKTWLESLYSSTVDFEMRMQIQVLDKLSCISIDNDIKQNNYPCKTTLDYVSFLVDISSKGTFGEIVSALAPCPWTYVEIAQLLSKFPIENEIYRNWIQFYSSTESCKQVEEIKQILNLLGTNKNKKSKDIMKENFASACKYEYLFWDMVYNFGNT
ncbi:MAG TPA: thiaminase II [Candidatus Nitrosocosmicus sp.]